MLVRDYSMIDILNDPDPVLKIAHSYGLSTRIRESVLTTNKFNKVVIFKLTKELTFTPHLNSSLLTIDNSTFSKSVNKDLTLLDFDNIIRSYFIDHNRLDYVLREFKLSDWRDW